VESGGQTDVRSSPARSVILPVNRGTGHVVHR
jgi:hypothetical protein